ncbi:MAG TPA: hypothetical protein VNO70_23630, partial [Blastocatellia bacterium]|nr:hypothetical protein [Blastocatellia bacterium]
INSLNPEMVVVGGEITAAWPLIEADLLSALRPKVFRRNLACARIAPSAFEEKASLIGAILQALSPKLAVAKIA